MHNIFFEIDKNLTLGMSKRFRRWIEGGFLSNLFTFFRDYGPLPVFSGREINLPDAAMLGFFITLIEAVTGAKSNSKAVTRLSPFVAKLELRNLRSHIFCSMIKGKGEPGDLITGGNDAFVNGTREVMSTCAKKMYILSHEFKHSFLMKSGFNDIASGNVMASDYCEKDYRV